MSGHWWLRQDIALGTFPLFLCRCSSRREGHPGPLLWPAHGLECREERAAGGGGCAEEVVVIGWMLLCCSVKPAQITWECWRMAGDSQIDMALWKSVQRSEKIARAVCLSLFFLCGGKIQTFKNSLTLVRFSWEGNFQGGFAQRRQSLSGEQERTKEQCRKRDIEWKKVSPPRWWCKPDFSSRNCFH